MAPVLTFSRTHPHRWPARAEAVALAQDCAPQAESPIAVDEGTSPQLTYEDLAGRIIELSAWHHGAVLTAAARLVRQAQEAGETTAWVTCKSTAFFPPDMAAWGIDLAALAVVRVDTPLEAVQAVDKLARTGGLGFAAADVGTWREVPLPVMTRLNGLSRRHRMVIALLTQARGSQDSVNSLISLRGEISRARIKPGEFLVKTFILKDKRNGPGWALEETANGPPGLY